MQAHLIFRDLHIAAGVVALMSFWITAALRKGTALHRRTGSVYLAAMAGIVVTALPLAGVILLRGEPIGAAFLSYLALITGTSTWLARRAIRLRGADASWFSASFRAVAVLNLGAGLAVLALGVIVQAPLLAGLSLVGIVSGTRMLRACAKPAGKTDNWLQRHTSAIVGSGVAVHIAFLNLGLRHLIPAAWFDQLVYVAWFGPLVAGLVAGVWLNRKFGARKATARVHAAAHGFQA